MSNKKSSNDSNFIFYLIIAILSFFTFFLYRAYKNSKTKQQDKTFESNTYKQQTTSTQDYNDPYYVLGVDRDASQEEIKRVYKKLINIFHPDMENGNEEMFIRIQNAYDQISKQNIY